MTLTQDHLTFWQQYHRPAWAAGVKGPEVSIDRLVDPPTRKDRLDSAIHLLRLVRKNQQHNAPLNHGMHENTLREYMVCYDTQDDRLKKYRRWVRTMDKKNERVSKKDVRFLENTTQVF